MRHALAVGAHGLELDVHKTSDDHLVVAHDNDLSVMTGTNASIRESTLSFVQSRDAAYNWARGAIATPGQPSEHYPLRGRGPADEELRIPTLREVFETFAGVPLNLELKADGCESLLVDLLREFERHDDVIVVSFHDPFVETFRRLSPETPVAPGWRGLASFWVGAILGRRPPSHGFAALQIPDRLKSITIAKRRVVDAAHAAGLAVHTWTVDDPQRMNDDIDIGVDGIMTDSPSVLAAVLADRGAGWSGPPPSGASR